MARSKGKGKDDQSKSSWPVKRSQLPDNRNINENHEGKPFYSLYDGYLIYILSDGPTTSDDDDYIDWDSWTPSSNDELEGVPVCQEIKLVRVGSDIKGRNYSRSIEFEDHRAGGKIVKLQLLETDLILHQKKVLTKLIENGLDITSCPENPGVISQHICKYIVTSEPDISGIEKTSYWLLGWCGSSLDGDGHDDSNANFTDKVYILPDATYRFGVGEVEDQDRVLFKPTGKNKVHPSYRVSHTLDSWKQNVSSYAVGNSRLLFAISASMSAMLLEPLGLDGFGYHLGGESSSGKSITSIVALSVWGPPRQHCLKFDGTIPGLEQASSSFSSQFCVLDELGQIEDKSKIGSLIYKITHGHPKLRMQNSENNIYESSVRPWRLVVMTSGEKGVSAFMQEAGQKQMGGQAVRLLEIPAEAVPLSVFESIPDNFLTSKEFSEYIEQMALCHYGSAGRKFLHMLLKDYKVDGLRHEFDRFYNAFYGKLKKKYKNENTGGQFGRAARSFALVAFAGEHASQYGITGWPEFEAIKGSMKCFHDWKKEMLGNSKTVQDNKVIEKIVMHLSFKKNTFLDCADLEIKPPNDPDKIGYFKIYQKRPCLLMSEEYVLHQIFQGDVDEYSRGVRALKSSSILVRPESKGGVKLQHRNRLYRPNGQVKNTSRFYTICLRELKKTSDKLMPS